MEANTAQDPIITAPKIREHQRVRASQPGSQAGVVESAAWLGRADHEDVRLAAAGQLGRGAGDYHGDDFGGVRYPVIVSVPATTMNESGNVTEDASRVLKSRKTKTTTAELAKVTDDRVVHLGLLVALLGVLSVVV